VNAKAGSVLRNALWWLLATSFALGAVAKFLPGDSFFGDPYAVKFVEWGYPAWFRFVVGTGELVAAVLLVIPSRRTRFLGCALLVVILVGAVVTHLLNTDPVGESIMAPIMLAITGTLAWRLRSARPALSRPDRWDSRHAEPATS
jgi:uncharacterized membrane protein YphA (DoxX/SURF4 family)